MSEEDQMMRAIAMSLGQDIPMDQRAESPEVKASLGDSIKCWVEGILVKFLERSREWAGKCILEF